MRILLTGTTGKVGGYLARHWASRHQVHALTRSSVDLANSEALQSYLADARFDLLVNAAAVSTPEGCEAAPAIAESVNSRAPQIMAAACHAQKKRFLHLSTDYVLDGSLEGLKDENAPTAPNNFYGQTKLAGENAAREANPDATIARVSWVFGTAGEGFLEKIYRQIRNQQPLEAVADKYSMPTSAQEIAKALDHILTEGASGLFHLTQTAEEPVSWYRYATEVAAAAHEIGLTSELIPVSPRKMVDIPALRTNRPIHTAMRPARLETEFHHRMQPWTLVLRERVARLAQP